MSHNKRPGGLTTLAVLNFVFGGLGLLLILGMLALYTAVKTAAASEGTDISLEQAIGNPTLILVSILLSIVSVVLMITSGVGYLGLKKFLGYKCGNLYAIVSILGSVLGIMVSGLGIGTVIGLVYPVLTLVLLNTTFKDDFVN